MILNNESPLPAPIPPPPPTAPDATPKPPSVTIRARARFAKTRMRVGPAKKRELVRAVEILLAGHNPPSMDEACRLSGVKFNSFRRWRRLFRVKPRSAAEAQAASARMARARSFRKLQPRPTATKVAQSISVLHIPHDADFIGRVVARVIKELERAR